MHRLFEENDYKDCGFLLHCLSPDKELFQLQGARVVALENQSRIWVQEDFVIFVLVRQRVR